MLIVGLCWHVWITERDWDYWQDAPNSFNIFLLVQYILLALCIRVPVTTSCKQATITRMSFLLGLCLFINTIVGTVWFFELTKDPARKSQSQSKGADSEVAPNSDPEQ